MVEQPRPQPAAPQVPQTQVAPTEPASSPGSVVGQSPSVRVVNSPRVAMMLPDNQLGMEQPEEPFTPRTPVATPCRTRTVAETLLPQDDYSQPRPVPGTLHLSEGAIDARLRRLVAPRACGKYKVSKDIVEMYQNGGKTRMDVFHMFQSVGFDPDRFFAKWFRRKKFQDFKVPWSKDQLNTLDGQKPCTTEGARKCFILRLKYIFEHSELCTIVS